MRRTRPLIAAASTAALLVVAPVAVAPPAAAGTRHPGVVSERPVGWTPHVLDGAVKSIVQVGDTVVVAGEFDRVRGADGGQIHSRRNIFAFDPGTGEIREDFAPRVDGPVRSLAAGPDGTVYAGGSFNRVNGQPSRGLARLSLADGRATPGFAAQVDDGAVYRLAARGGQLYIGGSFRGVNGASRTGLARLDGATGKVDPAFDVQLGEARRGALRVEELAVSPDGGRLVIGGTFTAVEGQRRYQIAMLDTAASPVRLAGWSTESYAAACDYSHMHTYVRQIDFAPDGSYFAVVTAGGPEKKPGLCKTVARWETDGGAGAEPTWVNHTGGDSLYSVEVTGAAVYVGGHQRWMDNPEGDHNAGPGAVERSGIAAVSPSSGRALAWNPGRPRGHGVEALASTEQGLFVGSDTERLAGERHERLGMFPVS